MIWYGHVAVINNAIPSIGIYVVDWLADEEAVLWHIFTSTVDFLYLINISSEVERGCPVPVLALNIYSGKRDLNTAVLNSTNVGLHVLDRTIDKTSLKRKVYWIEKILSLLLIDIEGTADPVVEETVEEKTDTEVFEIPEIKEEEQEENEEEEKEENEEEEKEEEGEKQKNEEKQNNKNGRFNDEEYVTKNRK